MFHLVFNFQKKKNMVQGPSPRSCRADLGADYLKSKLANSDLRNIMNAFYCMQYYKRKAWKDIAVQLMGNVLPYFLRMHIPYECQYDRGGVDPAQKSLWDQKTKFSTSRFLMSFKSSFRRETPSERP